MQALVPIAIQRPVTVVATEVESDTDGDRIVHMAEESFGKQHEAAPHT